MRRRSISASSRFASRSSRAHFGEQSVKTMYVRSSTMRRMSPLDVIETNQVNGKEPDMRGASATSVWVGVCVAAMPCTRNARSSTTWAVESSEQFFALAANSPARRVKGPIKRDQVISEKAMMIQQLTPVLRPSFRRITCVSQRGEFAPQLDTASNQTSPFCHKVVKSFALVHRGGSGRRARFYSCSADLGVPQMWPHTAQHQRIKPPRSLILSTSRPPHRVHGGAGDGASPVVDMAIGQKANAMPRGYGFHRR